MIGLRYKKVYIEITNGCNLSCDFCIKNKRKIEYISEDKFKILLERLKPYTKYLYFHVMGEPLLHENINKYIDMAYNQGFNINITTNGYLIEKIKYNKNIRQVNISLHSYNKRYRISLKDYLDNIFKSINILSKNNTYINLRLWVNSIYREDIIKYIEDYYKIKIDNNNLKISNNIYINYNKEFIWPDIKNSYYNSIGTCYGTRDHIGILVDGTIVPCCLDSEGIIRLGNIYEDKLEEVINSKLYKEMEEGFRNNKKICELCRHCKFLD